MIEEHKLTVYSLSCDNCGWELRYTPYDRDELETYARADGWLIEEGSKGNNLHFCCHKCYLEHDRKEGEQ